MAHMTTSLPLCGSVILDPVSQTSIFVPMEKCEDIVCVFCDVTVPACMLSKVKLYCSAILSISKFCNKR